jgi:hypothetical protein
VNVAARADWGEIAADANNAANATHATTRDRCRFVILFMFRPLVA